MKTSLNVVPTRLGPSNLTVGTLFPHEFSAVPTVTDNLYNWGTISNNVVAISFQPTTGLSTVNGELSFGESQVLFVCHTSGLPQNV